MPYHQLFDLDQTLESTWRTYSEFLKTCLQQNNLNDAFGFLDNLVEKEFYQTTGDYILYKSLLYRIADNSEKALEATKEAWRFGYPRFWKFIPDSLGSKSSTLEDLQLLKPLYQDAEIQNFARSVFSDNIIPWGFDICQTPFCWFEQTILMRKTAKCYISGKSIRSGAEIYQFRFFNGSHDIPTDFLIVDKKAFDCHEGALENLKKYNTNTYQLTDYKFKIDYKHPLINSFWHTLDKFNLEETLRLIANPPVHSSPYIKYGSNESPLPIFHHDHPEHQIEKKINYGTGGEFVNLLYVLIKCGCTKEIVSLLPQLPSHIPLLLMCFDNANLNNIATKYTGFLELDSLFELAFHSYSKKTAHQVKKLAEFGKSHPEFRHNLAKILNTYELHLFSNSRPGANWFFQDFHHLSYAAGGGLLDFLISEPGLVSAMKHMQQPPGYLSGLSIGVVDAYENSMPFLYRMICLGSFYSGKKDEHIWMIIPSYLRESPSYKKFRAVHKITVKIIESWEQNLKDPLLSTF